MSAEVDVLVLGVGGMGASALAHLAARGLRVVGVEQGDVPNDRGSSTGETRVIRKAYYEDPRYVPLLHRAYASWAELEKRVGDELYVRTGCLSFGPRGHASLDGVRASVDQHGLPHEVLSASRLRERFPAFAPGPDDEGIYEEDAGFLRVEACTRAYATIAREDGAELVTGVRVSALELAKGRVTAALSNGRVVVARRLVVSAGPWLASSEVTRELRADIPLEVTRQVQLFFEPASGRAHEVLPGAFPAFLRFDEDRAFYGIPLHGEGGAPRALKVCRHHGGIPSTPETLDREVHASDVDDVRAFVARYLPAGDGPLLRSRVCMYTNTPDGHFVVGRHPAHANVVLLGGFSGHGFKMASVLGEIAASLSVDESPPFDLGLFSPTRFASA